MFTIYKVKTNLSDSPRAVVFAEVGSEGLARAICKHLNGTGQGNGQTAFVWAKVSPRVRKKVETMVKELQQRDTAEDVSSHIFSGIRFFNGSASEKTAYISLLVYRMKKLKIGVDGAAISAMM